MHLRLNREIGEVRLLRLNLEDRNKPRPPTEGNLLSLQLDHHRHGETPYVALSYVWGDPDNQVAILVNNVELTVRRNLYYALAELRRQRTEAWVWVDAICIDQANDDEKSWEVNRMRDIFQKAETVYHWLGPEADDSDFLLDWAAAFGREASQADVLGFVAMCPGAQEEFLLRFLSDKHPDIVPKPTSRGSSSSDMSTEMLEDNASIFTHRAAPFLVQLAIQPPPDLSSARMSKAMEALLRRSFFQRLWIVQELAVARNGVFLCGSRRLQVDHFDSILAVTNRRLSVPSLKILDKLKAKANPGTTSQQWLGGFNRNLIDNPALMVRRRRHNEGFPSLLSILQCSMGSLDMPMLDAADPRDLVFGLLGVSYDAGFLNLVADYSKSTIQLFTAVTRAFIRHDKKYLLGFSTFPKDLTGLPSWVPDWPRMCREGVPFFPISYGFPRFKASLDEQQSPEHSVGEAEDSPTLLLSGFRLGSITSILDTQSILNAREPLMSKIVEFSYESGITDDETIIRTCIMDDTTILGVTARTDSTYLGLAQKVFRGQERIEEEDRTPEDAALLSRYECLRDGIEGGRDTLIQLQFASFSWDVQRTVASSFRGGKRTLFATDGGGLGLGPSYMQKGDFIAILFGHKAPVILRPVESEWYSFVGEAYVDGVMDGDAMEEGKINREDFKIV
ncbi:heterokaryon incompatibility protein-domain-containing protein [Lasiosphaeria ovina]|uniref:Heterokaryon incompatibility protein-domain-containing protein n=1 Tax=Lasiosphaeria ovina TaxID=92902 RepID=A0AAE0NBG9_9PEZI|nr:heterokaryon incompatibility protein-domain-containing protein [Lasiosphaeria ovina]